MTQVEDSANYIIIKANQQDETYKTNVLTCGVIVNVRRKKSFQYLLS